MSQKLTLIIQPYQSRLELERSANKKGGRIFFKHFFILEDKCFPTNNWTDLSAAVLDMWIECLLNENNQDQILHFMDGNFALKLTSVNGSIYKVRFGISNEEKFIESSLFPSLMIGKDEFKNEVISAANVVIDLLKELNLNEDDYYLNRLIIQVEKFLQTHLL